MENTCRTLQVTTGKSQILLSLQGEEPPLISYRPAFNIDFCERLLGRKNGKVPRSTRIRLDTMQKSLAPQIHPRVSFKVHEISEIKQDDVTLGDHATFHSRKMAQSLKGANRAVVFVATVGRQIEVKINHLMQKGELANACVADALGSCAVEHLAEQFQNQIACEFLNEDQEVGLRFSPGYCDWPVTEQETLFSLVDNETAGVKLGKTCLMNPRKSISAVFGIYDHAETPVKHSKNPCLRCAKKDCIARRTAVQEGKGNFSINGGSKN